jgi:hypothetical protein
MHVRAKPEDNDQFYNKKDDYNTLERAQS